MRDWRYRLAEHRGTLLALAVFAVMFTLYVVNHPAGFGPRTLNVVATATNKAVLLALVAMAQTLPILSAGLDLSVGMVFVLSNCVASWIVVGGPVETTLGIVGVLLVGVACGTLNGLIVVYGRLQPIITTLATGAVYYGLALGLRPTPGGQGLGGQPINTELADFITSRWFGVVPGMLVVLLIVVLVVWVPFRRSVLGRGVYAVGSSEAAAYMSGVRVDRAKLAAYILSGLIASIAGLLLTFVTFGGEASAPLGGTYTLNSIAAVVVGGTSLFGGVGSAVGSIFGAFVLRTIEDLLFVFDLPFQWQPLFIGVILLIAVSLGSFRLLRIRNRLELYR